MTTGNEPRAGTQASQGRRPRPLTRTTVWLLCVLAALVLAVTIAMIAHSGAATCTGAASARAASARAAQRHAQIPACAPAVTNPVPGRR